MTTTDEALRVAREALTNLLRVFPTDVDMIEAGWGVSEVNEACDVYDAGQAALRTIALAVEGLTITEPMVEAGALVLCGQEAFADPKTRAWGERCARDVLKAALAVRSVALGDPSAKQDRAEGESGQEAAVQAWQHEDDPSRVISAIQKGQALRDGGASASSVRPYNEPLIRAASLRIAGADGAAPNDQQEMQR